MEELVINKYMAEVIENALRLTANINSCRTKETAFDREVMLATKYIKEVLGKTHEFKASEWWGKLSVDEKEAAWLNKFEDEVFDIKKGVNVADVISVYEFHNSDKLK